MNPPLPPAGEGQGEGPSHPETRAPIANARMYSVTPEADEAWKTLFRHVAKTSGVPLDIVDHPFPRPVSDLWLRPDLACAFMCGWPWIRAGARHIPVAAPIPREAGAPRYWSNLVVRADDPAQTLEDLKDRRIAYTILDSQSGFSALRHHLRTHPAPTFGEIVGPLTTPRRSIEAVAENRADIAPIDSYAHALLRRHLPHLTDRVRILVRTRPTPIPLLVASPDADPAMVAALRAALLAITDPALLEPLALQGFTTPLPIAEYQQMEASARAAEHAGQHDLTPFLRADAA